MASSSEPAAAAPATSCELAAVFAFVVELDRLKGVLRRTKPVGLDRYENSAEHSWQICLLAMVLARHCARPVDLQRVLEMLLVHDVPEIDCGDQIVYARDAGERATAEAAAAERIFGLLPSSEGERLLARWREYEARETPEAVFAYAVDRLMPVLQNLHGPATNSWREHRIAMVRVKEVNRCIGDALPEVWREVEPRIEALFASGSLERRADELE